MKKILITERLNEGFLPYIVKMAQKYPDNYLYSYDNSSAYTLVFAKNKKEAIKNIMEWEMKIFELDLDSLELPTYKEYHRMIKKVK